MNLGPAWNGAACQGGTEDEGRAKTRLFQSEVWQDDRLFTGSGDNDAGVHPGAGDQGRRFKHLVALAGY